MINDELRGWSIIAIDPHRSFIHPVTLLMQQSIIHDVYVGASPLPIHN